MLSLRKQMGAWKHLCTVSLCRTRCSGKFLHASLYAAAQGAEESFYMH